MYEDLNQLLAEVSPSYQEAFSSKLMEKLLDIQQMRRLSSDEEEGLDGEDGE